MAIIKVPEDIDEGYASEEVLVDWIKANLRTEDQRAWLAANDLTIPDLLNGRYGGLHKPSVNAIYQDWNSKVGETMFGE